MRVAAIAIFVLGCAAPVDAPPVFAGVGDPVPDAFVDEAVAEVEACLGYSCDLDGWDVYYAAVELSDMRFACGDEHTDCGPLPDGCTDPRDCPCKCKGFTLWSERQTVVSSDRSALKHELIHACSGLVTHDGPEWECQ